MWSLGIVLINMLFHRNPWKDPTPGDPNFEKFLRDPTGFLLAKFTGIGREVASYLVEHVLCTEVEDRVSAKEFGQWIRGLVEMIAGRKAVNQLKLAKLEAKNDKANGSLFVKSPIDTRPQEARKKSTSALTSSAPQAGGLPTLASLPPPSRLANHLALEEAALTMPDLDKDIEGEELTSASTMDGQITPADSRDVVSPEVPDFDNNEVSPGAGDQDAASLAHKRRKRGVRKGKAAQAAALAAAQDPENQEGRDVLLTEFAAAAQSLARDLSKNQRRAEVDSPIEFPPLGTTPGEMALVKKSKWKDLMKFSSGNPELEALARRVAERDGGSGGNWSAPAKMQQDNNRGFGPTRPNIKQSYTQTATMSSGFSSGVSSFGPVSSATSSSGADEEDWRKSRLPTIEDPAVIKEEVEDEEPRDRPRRRRGREEDLTRARQAALAAAAITSGMDSMGHFGAGPGMHRKPPVGGYTNRVSVPVGSQRPAHQVNGYDHPEAADKVAAAAPRLPMPTSISAPVISKHTADVEYPEATTDSRPALSSIEGSESTITSTAPTTASAAPAPPSPSQQRGPDKPKLKGQIQSLAKMLSGLKTKGKD